MSVLSETTPKRILDIQILGNLLNVCLSVGVQEPKIKLANSLSQFMGATAAS
jgi:hypothetical protein